MVLTLKSLGIQRSLERVLSMVRNGRVEAAEAACAHRGGAAGAVLRAALDHRGEDRSIMEGAVEEALLLQAPAFQARLGFLTLCAALAPLLGLLGTVTGMFGMFKMLEALGYSEPAYLAGGLSQALIATEAGLYVAIPCLLFRGLLGALAERSLARLEWGGVSMVVALLSVREAVEVGSRS